MPGLRSLLDKKQQWDQEDAANVGGNRYFPRKGDKVFFYFGWSGLPEGDDPWADLFEAYIAHEIPAAELNKRYPEPRYCPVESGHDENYDCPLCKDDYNTKKRMRFWMWVGQILRSESKEKDPQTEQAMWQGRMYQKWDINDWLTWDTSAWRDSCLTDIVLNADAYANAGQSLHSTMFQLEATGEGLQRRYKLTAIPASPALPEHLQEEAKKLTAIPQLLRNEIESVATVSRDETQASAPAFDPTADGNSGAATAASFDPTAIAPNNMVNEAPPAPPDTTPDPPPPEKPAEETKSDNSGIDAKRLY